MSLIFPFEWPHVYVPVLPLNMLLFFEAPLPFIFGVFPEALKMVDITEGFFFLFIYLFIYLFFIKRKINKILRKI